MPPPLVPPSGGDEPPGESTPAFAAMSSAGVTGVVASSYDVGGESPVTGTMTTTSEVIVGDVSAATVSSSVESDSAIIESDEISVTVVTSPGSAGLSAATAESNATTSDMEMMLLVDQSNGTSATAALAVTDDEAQSADSVFADGNAELGLMDQLLVESNSQEGGSSPDPLLGEESQLYVNEEGEISVSEWQPA